MCFFYRGKMVRYFIVVVAICAMYSFAGAAELYSDQYDDLDVRAILADDSRREAYYSCFMDTGPCVTDDAVFFKGHFAESIATKCSRCTEKQKQMFDIIVDWYVANQEAKWHALVAKFLEEAKRMNIPVA